MPPMVNAHLRTVSARASTDAFEETSGTPIVVFEGSVDAWYDERRRRVSGLNAAGGAVSDILIERSLLIDPPPFEIKIGHVVAFERDDSTDPITGTVQAVEAPRNPQVPDELNTVRLTLEVA